MAKITRHAIAERSTGWVLNLYYEDGSRRQLSCKSQAHAMQRLQEANAAPTAEFTLRQAYAKAKDHYAKLQNQQSPLGQFREVMAHFGPDTAVSAVGYAAVKDFQDKLTKAGNSPSTVNAKVAKIRLAREFAVQAGDETMPPIPSNVPLNFVEKDLWTPEQLALARQDLINRGYTKHADLLVFLYEMGCRHSEAFRLRAKDINLRDGTVHFFKPVPDHKNQNRRLPLTPTAAEAVRRHVDQGAELWRFDDDIKISRSRFDEQLRVSLLRCCIYKRRPIHTLRDTCLSRLGQAGCTAFEIMQWSGHKSLSAVSLYVQMDMSRLDKMKTLLSEPSCTPTPTTH